MQFFIFRLFIYFIALPLKPFNLTNVSEEDTKVFKSRVTWRIKKNRFHLYVYFHLPHLFWQPRSLWLPSLISWNRGIAGWFPSCYCCVWCCSMNLIRKLLWAHDRCGVQNLEKFTFTHIWLMCDTEMKRLSPHHQLAFFLATEWPHL